MSWFHAILSSSTQGGGEEPEAFGEILNDSFNRAELGDDYSINGTASWTLDGEDLTTDNGGSNYTHRLSWNYYQAFQEWDVICQVQAPTPSATTIGLGVGHQDDNGARNFAGLLNLSTNANAGKVFVSRTDASNNATILDTSATGLTVAGAEIYLLTMSRRIVNGAVKYTVTGERVSDGSTRTASWTQTLALGQSHYANGTGRFTIWSFGGAIKIKNLSVHVYDQKNIESLFVGHSIVQGWMATDLTTRYAANVTETYAVSAGPGERTAVILKKIQNLIDHNPDRLFLAIGTNDIASGVAEATYKANYQSIVSQMETAGLTVVILYELPRSGVDIATFNAWLESTFPNNLKIDIYTPLADGTSLSATYDAGDGVHPNQDGHTLIASTIVNAL